MQTKTLQAWQDAERLLANREHGAAKAAYDALLQVPELASMAHLRLSLIASAEGRHRDSIGHAIEAYERRLPDADLLGLISKRLMTVGEMKAAMDCASSPQVLGMRHPATLAELGKMMSDHDQPEMALLLLQKARHLGLDSAAMRYLIGLSQGYMGDVDSAQHELSQSLQSDPDFARAARALSKLKKQTASSNHVPQLQASLARIGVEHADAPLLHYALFKELDDLGDTAAAWQALSDGMRLRRKQISYDIAAEQALFDQLHGITGHVEKESSEFPGPTPIFIVGMPRSGTTLLERILGSHDAVADAGELRDFTLQLRWVCSRAGGMHLDLDLAQRASNIDWPLLGERYLTHTQWRAKGRAFYTDKLPTNFLNIGYIARALPQAKILHMVREPMDTCFSNLKELFAGAYPHSYDQIEMADHFRRYRRLMEHWHAQFPGRILDVHYEDLVADPGISARRVLDFCGLAWDEAVLSIEGRSGVVATASSAQVREPIHQRFLGQWRRYAEYLEPLHQQLNQDMQEAYRPS